MCTYLVKNGQNLIKSLDNVSFSDMGKGLKVTSFGIQQLNKALISIDVVFDENSMLKSTQGKEQQVLESRSRWCRWS